MNIILTEGTYNMDDNITVIPDNRITEKELNNFYESHMCYLPGMSICIEDITKFIKSKGWIK